MSLLASGTDKYVNYPETRRSYELLDTPLHYVLDSGYQADARPNSIYRYRISDEGYPNLFISDGNLQFPEGFARLARVRVFNPWLEPVAVQQAGSFGYRLRETWLNDLKPFTSTGPTPEVVNGLVSLDSHTFRQFERFDAIPDSGLGPNNSFCTTQYNNSGSVCGRGWQNTKRLVHENGSKTALVCQSGGTITAEETWTRSLTSSHASALYFLGDESSAPEKVSGVAVVPAAVGRTRGEVAVFPGVPRSGLSRPKWEHPRQNLVGFEGTRYQKLIGAIYSNPVQTKACDDGALPIGARMNWYYVTYELRKWAHALSSVKSTTTSGELAFSARPIYAADGEPRLTGPAPAPKRVPFNLNFDH